MKKRPFGYAKRRTIAVSSFAKRQTPRSRFSHYAGSDADLVALVKKHWKHRLPGYREGVLLVPVPPKGFYTATMPITPRTKLKAKFEARQPGEEPHVLVTAKGRKKAAKVVHIVLYHKRVLDEGDERSTDADWEVVSINAELQKNVPMHPLTMARNYLVKKGGTKGDYSAAQFANAIWYWSQHSMVE